jgi:hypothetical protein
MLFGEKGRLISLFAAVHALTGLTGSGAQGMKSQLRGNHDAKVGRTAVLK